MDRAAAVPPGGEDGDADVLLSDDEGGEGGLIKTRAQRAVEKKERRPLARTEGATVDVEALWAQMTAAPLRPEQPEPLPSASTAQDAAAPAVAQAADTPVEEELLTVTKTFVFAGQNTLGAGRLYGGVQAHFDAEARERLPRDAVEVGV